jgi:hydroxymethylpyrimidine/phosphomethylpyrimidine kinase
MNLNQVTLPCLDYDESVAFYRALGFVQIVDSPPRYARFECEAGATFSLHLVDRDRLAVGATVVYFETEQLDSKVANLKQQGFVFESEPVDQSWLWREAYLKDPTGNLICLYYAGKNRRYPPWRMS